MGTNTKTVARGRIETPPETLAKEVSRSEFAPDDPGSFTLGPQAEAKLLGAVAEADRGDVIPVEKLLQELGGN